VVGIQNEVPLLKLVAECDLDALVFQLACGPLPMPLGQGLTATSNDCIVHFSPLNTDPPITKKF
jgi:hypothetical protein